MPEARVAIAARVGLHARPAALFVKLASQQACAVRIGRPGQQQVDARSILAVLGLALGQHDEVVVTTEGDGDEASLQALVAFLEADHDAATG